MVQKDDILTTTAFQKNSLYKGAENLQDSYFSEDRIRL